MSKLIAHIIHCLYVQKEGLPALTLEQIFQSNVFQPEHFGPAKWLPACRVGIVKVSGKSL